VGVSLSKPNSTNQAAAHLSPLHSSGYNSVAIHSVSPKRRVSQQFSKFLITVEF